MLNKVTHKMTVLQGFCNKFFTITIVHLQASTSALFWRYSIKLIINETHC